MEFFKRITKQDVKSKKPFSFVNKTKSGKVAKSGTTVEFNDGSKTTLLNPSGKGTKYAIELGTNSRITNDGEFKTDDNGNELAYLDALKDSAKAYGARQIYGAVATSKPKPNRKKKN